MSMSSQEMDQAIGRLVRAIWGYVKSLVYAIKPTTLEELRANIEREIAAVSAEMCGRVIENWVQRIDRCKRARGCYMNEVEFHS